MIGSRHSALRVEARGLRDSMQGTGSHDVGSDDSKCIDP